MASTKIQNLPLKAPIGAMKIPTGGFGDYSITVSSIGDFIIDTFNLTTKDYVDALLVKKEDRIDTTGGFLTPVSQNSSVPDTTNDVIDKVAQALLDRIEYVKDIFGNRPLHNELDGRSATGAHPSTSISHKSGTVYTYLQQNESDINTINNVSIPLINQSLLTKESLIETGVVVSPNPTFSDVPSTNNSAINSSLEALTNRDEFLNFQFKEGITPTFDQAFADKIGGYPLNARIMLTNGDIVKSTVANNTKNPNVDMTGWVKEGILIVESIDELINLNNPKIGQIVFAKSYKPNLNTGGGDFICVNSNVLTENLATIFRHAQMGYEDYFWVRFNFETLTPEMCGANGTMQDSTIAIERFLAVCGTGVPGSAVPGKIYKTSKFIDAIYSKSVRIDFKNSVIKPDWNIPAGFGVDGSIRYRHSSGAFIENVSVDIDNLNIDLTSFLPSVSTSEKDRRGIRGLVIENPEHISINNYKCKGAFYGSGLMLFNYRYAELNGIRLPDCGYKLNPNSDDTGPYDAAGDAIYLGALDGHGLTNITNLTASAQAGFMGRAGIVLEQFADTTLSHVVTLNNANFDGYHRVVHQEDHGVGRVIWVGGSAKRFSNLIFNLGGLKDVNYLDATSVDIEVKPPFTYGGTSGINNFQGYGDSYFNNCNIKYLSNVVERGNKFINGGSLDLGTAVVDHAVSTKTHRLDNVKLSSNGGLLFYTSGNKGVIVNGGQLEGVAGSITNVIRSVNGIIKIGGNCVLRDASVFGENTITVGHDKNSISDTEIIYTGNTPAQMFNGSYVCAYKLNNVNIKSNNSRLELYGDGGTRYSINDCNFVNVGINVVNSSAADPLSILKVKSSELYYNDSYGLTSPIANSYGTVFAVFSDNLVFDDTTAKNIVLPTASASLIVRNNNLVKNGVIG